jgi:hypothetical protein
MRVEFGLIGNLAIQAPVHLIKIQLTASLCAHGLHLPSHAFAFPQNHSPLTLGDFIYTHVYIYVFELPVEKRRDVCRAKL